MFPPGHHSSTLDKKLEIVAVVTGVDWGLDMNA